MTRFIAKRLFAMIPVMFLVSLGVFFIVHLTPGDPALLMLGEEATPQNLAALRKDLGLDQPLHIQYWNWLSKVLQGDLGKSIRTRQSVSKAIEQRLPATLELTTLAMLVSLCIAIPTGIIAATRRNSASDLISTTGALLGVSMPNFFLAILLIFLFSLHLRWLPAIGYTAIDKDVIANLRGMVLPSLTLGLAAAAVVSRLTRSSLLEVLNQDYVRTARAKGLAERFVVFRHALKNALIPVITIIGLQVGALLGGAVITETIFVIPGIGSLVVTSIFERDYPLLQGAVLFLAFIHLIVNLVVDILYGFLDPRIRYA